MLPYQLYAIYLHAYASGSNINTHSPVYNQGQTFSWFQLIS